MTAKKNKSILLIMPYGSVGGMERLALSFYEFYKSKGYNIKALKFIKLENDIIKFGSDELFLSNVDFSSMTKLQRILFYLKAPLKIKKLVNTYDITHSISFGDMANMFSSVSFSNEFKIGSIHALKSAEFVHQTFFHKVTKFGYKSTYKNLNKLVCISKAIKHDLIDKCDYKFSNLKIIYNPHNVANLVKLSNESIIDKNELELFSKKTIIFLGRLSIQKSPWHFIKAFKLVLEKTPDVNLVLLGDGDENVNNYIKELINELGIKNNVHLLGRRSNPYKYLKLSNVLILSSYYEGTPNVIVESIAVGTPIVSSYCTKGIIELMSISDYEESEENIELESGIVTPNLFKGRLEIPTDNEIIPEELKLAEALEKVLSNESFKATLLANRNQLLSKFNLDDVSNSYLEVN